MIKKAITISISSLILIFLFSSCDFHFRDGAKTSIEKNSLTTIQLPINSSKIENNGIDKIIVSSILLNRSGVPIRSTSTTYEKSDFENQEAIPYDLKYHGKHEITIKYYSDGKESNIEFIDYVLTADEYTIGLLRATVPVSYFSLVAADEDGSYFNSLLGSDMSYNPNAPKIIALERSGAYNWNDLLPNMYGCPFLTDEKLKESVVNGKNFQNDQETAMIEYVTYLHELNPSSKFTIFINDLDNDHILFLLADTGIGFGDSQIFAISDGTATYSAFTQYYGKSEENNNSLEKYANMENVWNKVKIKALTGDSSYHSDLRHSSGHWWDRIGENLLPVQANDPSLNIKWIVNRKNVDTFGSTAVAENYIINNDNVLAINLYNLYTALNETEKSEVKQLLNVDFDMINQAEAENKKIMLFLGTKNDNKEKHLEDYIRFTTEYCGDDYAYFYKGHPGDMDNLSSSKISELEQYGVEILDFSVPAEFFYLFKSGLSGSGFSSSTFGNIESEIDRIAVIAETTYENITNAENYKDKVEIFINRQSDGNYYVQDRKNNRTGVWNPNMSISDINWK